MQHLNLFHQRHLEMLQKKRTEKESMKGMRSICFYDYKGSMFLFSSASIWVPAEYF